MSKTRNRRPGSDTRSARRSLVELTAEVSRAVDDGLAAAPASPVVVAIADVSPRLECVEERPGCTELPKQEAPVAVARAEAPDRPAARSREPTASDSAAEMMVKIAKDYHNSVLDNIKAGLNAALDHAKDFAEARPAGQAAADPEPQGAGSRALGTAAAAFHAQALELLQANLATTLDYARELASARTAAQVAELSGTQARKNCELMLKQADALKAAAQSFAKQGSERGS